jgi:CubicO group peptidase (beta-lactamase class C family)
MITADCELTEARNMHDEANNVRTTIVGTDAALMRGLASLLAVVLVAAACDPSSNEPTAASLKVDALFAPLTEEVQPGAAVMIIRDGEIVHQAGYGYANLEEKLPITADTAFRLASVSKQFTAMAIIILAEQGALSYDDPASRYLPVLAPYDGVTIRQLITHTSGLPEYYEVIDTGAGMPTNADALALVGAMGEPMFAPGARYEYSNPAYDMLPPLIEAVSGMDFATFMQDRIFGPLGMHSSYIFDHREPAIPYRVTGYEPDTQGFRLNDYDPLNHIVGSGGMYSTLNDLFRWDQALYGETLVSRATIEEAFTPARLNNGESIDYGFGWRIDTYQGHRRVRHGGSWIGFRTHIARYPDDRFSIVILSNRADFDPESYIDPITDIYIRPAKP